MTFREKRLMRITKKILKLNRGTELLLTGSLMLAVRGIAKRREANDIDIIFTDGGVFAAPNYIPKMPKGFTYVTAELDGSQTDCIKFKKGNIHVDFLYSEEEEEGEFCGIPCASIQIMASVKRDYSKELEHRMKGFTSLYQPEYEKILQSSRKNHEDVLFLEQKGVINRN